MHARGLSACKQQHGPHTPQQMPNQDLPKPFRMQSVATGDKADVVGMRAMSNPQAMHQTHPGATTAGGSPRFDERQGTL